MKRIRGIAFMCMLLLPSGGFACPVLAGRFILQGEDGIVRYTVLQNACSRVEIISAARYLGKDSGTDDQIYVPDGHSLDKNTLTGETALSSWKGNMLQIGSDPHHYYKLDAAGDLVINDGEYLPQCKGSCEFVALREDHFRPQSP